MIDIKDWIKENLQYSRGLICKKCKREWFEKYDVMDCWEQIHKSTQFLDILNPTFPQRVWHIINDNSLVKCANPSCQISPKFWSFNIGYLQTCSLSCAQLNPSTQEKIQSTNLEKYGVKYGLQNRDIINKRHDTLIEKHEVENISLADGISEKKQEICFKNCEPELYLETPDLIKEHVDQKFKKDIIEYIKLILPPTEIIEENTKSILANNYELDIYIPSKKLAIECNGLFLHGEVGGSKGRRYHINKTNECESKGIHLIHIIEDEWISHSEIIKSKIKYILHGNGNNSNSIYARKCEVREISSDDKNIFLENYHIQGNDKSKIRLGLYYNNELVAVMTFGDKRIFMNIKSIEGEYELIRYAASKSVVGGGSKLLSHFIKKYSPKKITSYADRRWTYSKTNIYEKMGFKKVSDGTPNYWYFGKDGSYRRFHRFGFAKHTLPKKLTIFDPNLTEWENMKNNGWDRIWDCGNLKYEMIF